MSKEGLRKSVGWLFAGNIGNQLLTFAAGVVLARILSPADFGMLVTINLFTGMAGLIATGGMGQALVRAKEITKADKDIIFTAQMIMAILIFSFFYAIAPYFADYYQNDIYDDLLRLSATTFLLRPFVNLPSSLLQREMRFKPKAMISVLVLVFSSTTSIVLALLHFGVWSLIMGGLVGAVANVVMHIAVTRWVPGINLRFSQAAHLAKYGGLVTLSNVINYFHIQTSNFLISVHQPPVFLGLFNKADSLRSLPILIISGSIYQVSFRALAKVQHDIPESQRLFLRTIELGALYLLPIYVALWFAAFPFIEFVFGKSWLPSAPALSILSASGFFMLLTNQSGAVLEAFNRIKEEIQLQLATWPVQIALLLVLLNLAPSLDNLALVVTFWSVIYSLFMLNLARKTLQLRWRRIGQALASPFACNALLFLGAWAVDSLLRGLQPSAFVYLLAFIPLIGLIYLLLAYLLPFEANRTEVQRWFLRMKGTPPP
jgi:O-antigen/teichoic acid export membrane protein